MAIYRDRIETAIKPLLADGFELSSVKEASRDFGNTEIVLTSNEAKVRIRSDRGQILVDVAPAADAGWYDLNEFLALAGLETDNNPWESPQAAVDALRTYGTNISDLLGRSEFLKRLATRY
jgi:hypothetical protein